MTEQGEETEQVAPTAPRPAEKEESRPFDLGELLRSRKKGEGVGFWETLAYMDYQDRKEERAWRREQTERNTKNPPTPTSSPEVEGLKKEVSDLKETVSELLKAIRSRARDEAQEKFVAGVVKQTTDQIMPRLEDLSNRLEAFEKKGEPAETSELTEIRDSLQGIVDQIGEKVGAKGMTLSDVEQLMGIIESIEKRFHKGGGEGGEVDYKTTAVSTIGEIGKELITAYREIETSKSGGGGFEVPKEETPASTMQTIIKRQVQNYLTTRMKAGAVTFNVAEAAKELGLTPGQIVWAYKALMKEGFFQVKVSSKGKTKVRETETIGGETEIPISTETEEEQVFNPPAET